MLKALKNGPYILWMIIFTIVPLFTIFYYGFTTGEGSFTFCNILAIFESLHMESLLLSLLLAVLSTVFCLVLAYPLVLILTNGAHKGLSKTGFIVFIFILPMWMNYMLRTVALRLLLSSNGVINVILGFLHLPILNIYNTPVAVLIGMIYDYLPFMILPLYNSISRIDKNLIEAAMDLGGSYFTVLKKIILPLSVPGIISGITMVFIPAISEFVIADLLGGGKILLIGNVIEQEFMQANNWHLGSGLSIVLMVLVVASMFIMELFDKEGEGTAIW